MLILSKYSHLFVSKEGRFLLYNSEVNMFVELTKQQYYSILQFAKTGKVNELSRREIEYLLDKKIIVEEENKDDYYNKIKFITRLNCFSYDTLTLNIIPTTACNFSCSYCFEKSKPIRIMSDKIIDDLCTFVNKNTRAHKINLIWYGGEPLLALNVIRKILDKITTETDKPIVHQSLISNGYCINGQVCNLFKEYKLDDVQITLDGSCAQHNSKRFTNNDHNTYDRIVRNIGIVLHELPFTHVHVRINIDENNKRDYHRVTNELRTLYDTDRLTFYPGFLRIEDSVLDKMKLPSIVEQSKRNFYFDLECEGESVNFFPIHRNKSCCAVKLNTFIIGPQGEFYKCWNDVGFEDRIIGYINSENISNQSLLLKYLLDGTMFDDPKCRECFFFPICGGGCPQYRLKNKFQNGHYNLCSTYQDGSLDMDYLNRCLEEHYKMSSYVIKLNIDK